MQEHTASETPQCRQPELRQAARTLPSVCTWAQISEIHFLYFAGEKHHQTPGFLPVLCLPVYWFFPTQVLSRQGQHHRSCSILTYSSPCCHQDKGGDIAPEGWGKCFFSHLHGIDGPAWAEQEQSWGERPWGGKSLCWECDGFVWAGQITEQVSTPCFPTWFSININPSVTLLGSDWLRSYRPECPRTHSVTLWTFIKKYKNEMECPHWKDSMSLVDTFLLFSGLSCFHSKNADGLSDQNLLKITHNATL